MQRRLLLAIVTAALAALVIGAVVQSGGPTCEQWQRYYAQVAEVGRGGVLGFINEGPAADRLRQLEKEQPADCSKPEV